MVYNEKDSLNVVAGPGKMDVLMSVAYAYGSTPCLVFEVTGANGAVYPLAFTSVEHEDNSGESFNVSGRMDYFFPQYADKTWRYRHASDFPNKFHGYYNARTRRGAFTVEYQTIDDGSSKEIAKK